MALKCPDSTRLAVWPQGKVVRFKYRCFHEDISPFFCPVRLASGGVTLYIPSHSCFYQRTGVVGALDTSECTFRRLHVFHYRFQERT